MRVDELFVRHFPKEITQYIMSIACADFADAKNLLLCNKNLGLYPARRRLWSSVVVRSGRSAESCRDIYKEFPHLLSYATTLILESVSPADFPFLSTLVTALLASSISLKFLQIYGTSSMLCDSRFVSLLAPHFVSIAVDACTYTPSYAAALVEAAFKANSISFGLKRRNRVIADSACSSEDTASFFQHDKRDELVRNPQIISTLIYRSEDDNSMRYGAGGNHRGRYATIHSPILQRSLFSRLTELRILHVYIQTVYQADIRQLLAKAGRTLCKLKLYTIDRKSRSRVRHALLRQLNDVASGDRHQYDVIDLSACISLRDLTLRLSLHDTISVLRTVSSETTLDRLHVSILTLRATFSPLSWDAFFEAVSRPGCFATPRTFCFNFYTWFDESSIKDGSIDVINMIIELMTRLTGHVELNIYGLDGSSQRMVSQFIVP